MERSTPARPSAPEPAESAWRRVPAAVAEQVLRPAFADVVDGVVSALDHQAPHHGPFDGPLAANLRAGLELALEQFAELVGDERSVPDTTAFEVLGRKQARAGLPMDDLLAYYRLGGLVSWRVFSRAHHEGAVDAGTLALLGEALFAYLHELSAAATAGYSAAQSDAASLIQARRYGLVRRLVLAAQGDLDGLARHADQVGWQIPARLAVLVSAVPSGRRPHTHWPDDVITAPVDDVLCGLVPLTADGDRSAELEARTAPDATVVVGPTVPPDRAPQSFRRAVEVHELVAAGLIPPAPLVHAAAHSVTVLVQRESGLVGDLAATLLEPLLRLPAARREPLLATLAAWLEDPGHPSAIAASLCVHPQTVRYRVRRLRALLGALLDDPGRRLELMLAVRAVRLGLAGPR